MAARRIRIATRRSELAIAQSSMVVELLRATVPEYEFQLVPMDSEGDATSGRFDPARRGMFASALEAAIVAGSVDAAIHSLKDVGDPIAEGTVLAAFPERVDSADVLVGALAPDADQGALARLPAGAIVGTASSRRAAAIARIRPDVRCKLLRGNLPRRIAATSSDDYDVVVLAAAGLVRLGLESEIGARIPVTEMVPEPGQGAVVVQAAGSVAEVFSPIDHGPTRVAVTLERAVAAALGGGCEAPIGVHLDAGTAPALAPARADRRAGQGSRPAAARLLVFASAPDRSHSAIDEVDLTPFPELVDLVAVTRTVSTSPPTGVPAIPADTLAAVLAGVRDTDAGRIATMAGAR